MSTRRRLVMGGTSAATGVLGTVVGASENLLKGESAVRAFFAAAPEIRFPLAALLLVVAFLFFREALNKQSSLRHPKAIVPRNDVPDQLIDREGQVRDLKRLCEREQLIFVRGSSGVGKSALVLSGLLPELDAGKDYCSFYVGSWGSDWEKGPLDRLSRAIFHRLAETPLKLAAVPAPEQLLKVVGRVKEVLGCTPLFVLDQFDEYQTQHTEKLLENGAWIAPEELCRRNRFWKLLHTLLTKTGVTCIFVARNDTELGMVNFDGLARAFRVPAPNVEWVPRTIKTLTDIEVDGQPAIDHPESGWTRLRGRLIEDLSAGKEANPVQVSFALKALSTLPALTPGAYDAVGGLDGLIASLITEGVRVAAYSANVPIEVAFGMLQRLVNDAETGTVKVSERELVQDDAARRAVLQKLEEEEFVKSTSDGGERQWLLFHDFFAPAVNAAVRRRDAITQDFLVRLRGFEEAHRLWDFWDTLLPMRTQLRIWRNARARRAYWANRGYAALSVLRFTPALLFLGLGVAMGAWIRRDLRSARLAIACASIAIEADREEECVQLFHAASPATRFRAFELSWPNGDVANQFKRLSKTPWPSALPDESGFVHDSLVPCALGERLWRFSWNLSTGVPLLHTEVFYGDPRACAIDAMHLTQRRAATARALLPSIATFDAEFLLILLAELEESDLDYETWVAKLKAVPSDATPRPRLLAPARPLAQMLSVTKGRLDLGRERLVRLMERLREPWASIHSWRVMRSARPAQLERMRRLLLDLDLSEYRGDYELLTSYVPIFENTSPTKDRADAVLRLLDPATANENRSKWRWLFTLCELGVPGDKIPLTFDGMLTPSQVLDLGDIGPLLFGHRRAGPLETFVTVGLCKDPDAITRPNDGFAVRLAQSLADPKARETTSTGAFGMQSSDLNRTLTRLWHAVDANTAWKLLLVAVAHVEPDDFGLGGDSFGQLIRTTLTGASAEGRQKTCTVLRQAATDTRASGAGLGALLRAAKAACDPLPAEEVYGALQRARQLSTDELQELLEYLPGGILCERPCSPLSIALLQQNQALSWLSPLAAVGALCPNSHPCPEARNYAQRIASSNHAPSGDPRIARTIAERLLTFSRKVPPEKRLELIETMVEEVSSMHPRVRTLPQLGLLHALCNNPVHSVAAALEELESHPAPQVCAAHRNVRLPRSTSGRAGRRRAGAYTSSAPRR